MPSSVSEERIERPAQAVILAGGRGTRLRPITDTRPKPMVEIHGRPFLEYIVEMLRDQGIERILMLTGYLPEVIEDHFGGGRGFGVEIQYSVTAPDDLTGHRMKVAAEHLDPCFLLLYCDNYWPLRLDDMWDRFAAAQVPAMVTVYSNPDQYSRDSVRVDDEGYVRIFDRSRTTPGLRGIEISYALLRRSVLDLLPEKDTLFEEAVYPPLANRGELLANVSDHRYYSVGSLERLPTTERFLARRPAVVLDRDGVLNRRPPKAEYVRSPDEFEWLPGTKDALRLFREAGHRVIVVSNQAGIARGAMTEENLADIHERMKTEAAAEGGRIDAVYHCPHGWDESCECRKPKPGMLFRAQRDFDLDLTRTPFIGDDERDEEAADAAGCPALLVSEQVGLRDLAEELTRDRVERVA